MSKLYFVVSFCFIQYDPRPNLGEYGGVFEPEPGAFDHLSNLYEQNQNRMHVPPAPETKTCGCYPLLQEMFEEQRKMSEDVKKLKDGQVNKCFDFITSLYIISFSSDPDP